MAVDYNVQRGDVVVVSVVVLVDESETARRSALPCLDGSRAPRLRRCHVADGGRVHELEAGMGLVD